MVLAILLTGQVRSSQLHPELNTTGLLQLTWLVGQEPSIAERVADTAEPTEENLRRAGLFEVQLGGNASHSVVRRRTGLQGLIHDE